MDQYQIILGIRYIVPEIILFLSGIIGLLYGVFKKNNTVTHVTVIVIIGLLVSTFYLMNEMFFNCTLVPSFNDGLIQNIEPFGGAIKSDLLVNYLRICLLVAAILCMLLFIANKNNTTQFEIPVLLVISTGALMLMTASNDLLTMYLSMELSSITMYICISSDLERKTSSEAGLKYFILSSVASCVFLFGTSIITGCTGSFTFETIGSYCINTSTLPILFIFGLMMVVSGFLFKMSAAPFHAWTPDVYNGAPWHTAIFIGSVSKVAIVGLFVRMIYSTLHIIHLYLQPILCATAVLSMFIGAFGAIAQKDLRRMLAYSTIGNIGFTVAAVSTLESNGLSSGLLYIVLYSVTMFIPILGVVVLLYRSKTQTSNEIDEIRCISLDDIAILPKKYPYIAASFTVIMLSMIGLPPFAGFFGKFYILNSIIASDMHMLAVLFVIAAVLSSFYYIRIVKNMYFSSTVHANVPLDSLLLDSSKVMSMILTVCCIINVFFIIAPSAPLEVITKLININTINQ